MDVFHRKITIRAGLLMVLFLCGCAQQQTTVKRTEPDRADYPSNPPEIVISTRSKPSVTEHQKTQKPPVHSKPAVAPENKSIWPRIRRGMQLVHHSHPRLDEQLEWYASNQSYTDRILARGNPYLFHIVNQLEQRQMPLELALLPVVESAFDPFAYSHSQAAGLWQFMPRTGQRFGLKKNWWYDGRKDPVASTAAAIDYLSYLHRFFDGDWLLALAAYNSGEGNVSRAIKQNRKLGKPTDFWSLKLPRETHAYVPQLLAVAAIIREPEKFNTTLPQIANRPYFDKVELREQADLARLAKLAEIDKEEIHKLNAGYNRWVTDPDGIHPIFLPVGAIDTFNRNLATAPKSDWVAVKEYVVKKGDSLYTIARHHGVSVNQLKQTNLLKGNTLQIGQRLQLPGASAISQPVGKNKNTRYVVASGDSLWRIARKHNVSVSDLAKWNQIDVSTPLKPGQTLSIGSRQNVELAAKEVRYKVRHGDSLHRIASKFDLNVSEIVRWNKLNPKSYLQPGQRLTLFVDNVKI